MSRRSNAEQLNLLADLYSFVETDCQGLHMDSPIDRKIIAALMAKWIVDRSEATHD